MVSHSGVAAKMFTTLANEGVNIIMISTSEIKISCIIQRKYTELAVTALHDAFGLEKKNSLLPSCFKNLIYEYLKALLGIMPGKSIF